MLKIELYLNKIIKCGLYTVLLTPLVFWPRALFAFMTPKFILFQVLVEIIFAFWLILLFLKPDFRGIWKSGFRKWLMVALVIFFIVSFLSAIFGVDFSRSFWGIGARLTGLFAELHFLIWFLVLISYLKTKKDWYQYLDFSFFVAFGVATTAFYQNSQLAMVWGSTVFNNPTFVAPYLLFHFFWGLYRAFSKPWLFGIGSALIFFVILLAQIRGAILGLFAGVALLGIFLIFSNTISRRLKTGILVLFILFFAGFLNLWIFCDSQIVQNVSMLKRLTQFSLSETTAKTRILTWQTALEGVKKQPFFGAGPENFNYIFNANYDPRLLKFGGGGFGETWFDKPHNAFLEILTETGIIGGLAYALIWFAVALNLLKFSKFNQPNNSIIPIMELKILSFILTSAFVSYIVAMFFSFDSFGSWFSLFLFLALLISFDSVSNNANNINKKASIPSVVNIYSQLASAVTLFFLLALLYINYGIWRANMADADALRVFSRNPTQGITLFKKSLSYFTPYKSEYQFDFIASIAGAVEKGIILPDLENTINFALGEADKAIASHPKDAAKYTDMARIYNILGTAGRDSQILAQAEIFGKKSLELSPNRQETLFYLARTSLLKNDAPMAVNWAKQAVLADPEARQSHWYLGLAFIASNQQKEGVAEIKRALELGYKPQNKTEENFIKNLISEIR